MARTFFNETRGRGVLINSQRQAHAAADIFEINSNTAATGREPITGSLFRSAILFTAPLGRADLYFLSPFLPPSDSGPIALVVISTEFIPRKVALTPHLINRNFFPTLSPGQQIVIRIFITKW